MRLEGSVRVPRRLISRHGDAPGERAIPEETPVAFTFNRETYAVMMASPVNLEDFAYGFAFNERIIDGVEQICELETVELRNGIELRMALTAPCAEKLRSRTRRFAGPAGCGLCGLESLEEALASPPQFCGSLHVDPVSIFRAMHTLRAHQPLNVETHGVHAAGFWSLEENAFVAVREDVGRHNALDKLTGALLRTDVSARDGFLALTSRVSIELVQKAARLGCPVLVAISVPTALALKTATDANLTLAAIARDDSFEVFTHPERILSGAHVA